MPPNTLMRIALTPLSMRMSSKAFWTTSALAPPPMSRKFAASPPSALIASIVAITRPAPFPITPISPLSFTYVSLLLLASCSKGSSPSASQRPPYPGCLKRALSSRVIFASAATTFPSFVSMRGLISASSASSCMNKRNKEEKYPPTCVTALPSKPAAKAKALACHGIKPSLGVDHTLAILSGVLAATSSMSTPPSLLAMIAIDFRDLSTVTPK